MFAHRLWIFFVTLALVGTTACGGCKGGGGKDACKDVTCEEGTCDPDSGECVTSGSSCDADNPCDAGFDCVEGECVATFSCDDDNPCDRGDCVDGACQNPDRCAVDDDCIGGYACDGDSCVADSCDQVECDRGVCEKSSGECVNAAVCTATTQDTDCIEGNVCYSGSCTPETEVCEDIACDRGVCDVENLDCMNAESCGGDDQNCLDGFFCDAADVCVQNVCDANMVSCPRGVCNAATGTCVNAENCTALDECRDGFYCVQGTCTDADDACDSCPGNQDCEYDEGNLDVTCIENAGGCVTSIDCVGDRVCEAGACANPTACAADSLEANDSMSQAVDWFAGSFGSGASASICMGDADWFSFDTTQDPDFTGTLIAEVVFAASDIGNGNIELELFDASGTSVASNTSMAGDQRVRVEFSVGNINQGVYTLSVSDAGDVGLAGIDYTLYFELANATAAQLCSAAPEIVGTVMGDTSATMSNALGSSCLNEATATEEAWYFDVTQRAFVTVDLTAPTFDAVVSLRAQCVSDGSELGCADDGGDAAAETISRRLDPGRYFVVVQGTNGAQQGTYSLAVTQEPIVCTSADNTCVDAMTSNFCNARGTGFDTETCDTGCDMTSGNCMRDEGDVCATAIDATSGFTGTLSMGTLNDDYNPGTACVPEGSFAGSVTDGPDGVFRVTLNTNDVVYATVRAPGFNVYHGMYLVDDCADVASSCILGVNDTDFSGAETLEYVNTGAPGDYFLIVDSEEFASGDLAVEIQVGPRVCTPGTQQCNGTMLETCNDSGLAYDQKACSFGCDTQTVACVTPPNDLCAGAIDVSAGGQFTGLIEDYSADYQARNCTGFTASGRDGVYTVSGNAGDIVHASLSGSFDVSIYAASDCGDIGFTCLGGDDNGGSGTTEEITFRLPSSDPVFLFVDTFSSSSSGMFTLDVQISAPTCTNYESATMCQADGTTLQACNASGELEDYACATTCAAGACDMPTGDRCFDAIMLFDGSTFSGSFSDYTNDYNPFVGTCLIKSGDRQPGPDSSFAIDLAAGDLLTATLTTTTSSAGMYILEDCGDATGSCLTAAPRSDELQFWAPTTGRYFLIVDSTSSSSSVSFDLDVSIQQGFTCQPGASTCDSQSNTVTVCSDDGLTVENSIACVNGCRATGQCNPPSPAPDTCAAAATISGPAVFLENYGRFTNEFNPGANTMNSCGLTLTTGPDAVYAVTLGPNEVVDVTVDDLNASGSPRVYIVTDCTDVDNTCVDSDSDTSSARAGYISASGETVYVVVDNSSSTVADPFVVDIDVRPSQCAASLQQCTGSNSAERCTRFGEIDAYDCFFGCTSGDCLPPTNDTCAMPFDVSAGGTFTIPMDDYMPDYDPGINGCTGWYTDGPDGVFQVSLMQDQVVSVTAAAADFDVSLYMTTTCGDAMTCVAGQDLYVSTPESFTYRAPSASNYFIYIDSSSSTPTGTFDLQVDFPPTICTPGGTTCDANGTDVQVCDSLGIAQTAVACDAMGCTPGNDFCTTQDGELCVSAIDATAGGQFTGTFADFVDDYDFSLYECTDYDAPGPDAVYYIDLLMGQTVTATLNAASDTSLYLTSTCGDIDAGCLAGEDLSGSGESVTYTATANQRVYLYADNYDFSSSVTFTLDVTIQ